MVRRNCLKVKRYIWIPFHRYIYQLLPMLSKFNIKRPNWQGTYNYLKNTSFYSRFWVKFELRGDMLDAWFLVLSRLFQWSTKFKLSELHEAIVWPCRRLFRIFLCFNGSLHPALALFTLRTLQKQRQVLLGKTRLRWFASWLSSRPK